MKRLASLFLIITLLLAGSALAYGNSTTVTGWVSDMKCGASHAKSGGEDCVKRCVSNGLALVTDGDSKVWKIENEDMIKGSEGKHVKVIGTMNLEKGTFHITKVMMMDEKSNKS